MIAFYREWVDMPVGTWFRAVATGEVWMKVAENDGGCEAARLTDGAMALPHDVLDPDAPLADQIEVLKGALTPEARKGLSLVQGYVQRTYDSGGWVTAIVPSPGQVDPRAAIRAALGVIAALLPR
jgi:hypothetical protein